MDQTTGQILQRGDQTGKGGAPPNFVEIHRQVIRDVVGTWSLWLLARWTNKQRVRGQWGPGPVGTALAEGVGEGKCAMGQVWDWGGHLRASTALNLHPGVWSRDVGKA